MEEAPHSRKFLQALQKLDLWFERQKRVLPWRSEPTAYRVWISEIMLQQTQVATVIPYFERFIERFPAVEILAEAPIEDVLLQWSGLGYYSRARNLHAAARCIVKQGGFPKTRTEWLELPGIGSYTAGAILSIALDEPEAILDGNVERVLSRVFRVDRSDGDKVFKESLWKFSRLAVESGFRSGLRPSNLNQALMELGATLCSPKNPACAPCPFASLCGTRARGDFDSFPPPRVRPKMLAVAETLHCVLNGKGQVLLQKGKQGKWRAGLWDFLTQDPKQCPELKGVRLQKIGAVATRHTVTHHAIRRSTEVWQIVPSSKRGMEPKAGTDFRWVCLQRPGVPVGSPFLKVVEKLSAHPAP